MRGSFYLYKHDNVIKISALEIKLSNYYDYFEMKVFIFWNEL